MICGNAGYDYALFACLINPLESRDDVLCWGVGFDDPKGGGSPKRLWWWVNIRVKFSLVP